MTIFNARVQGARAEDGKIIFDVDVAGQKSAPWAYKELPKHGDLWGLNIHTSGEERDRIVNAISAYTLGDLVANRARFELAQAQTILLSAGCTCLRCAQSSIKFDSKRRAKCEQCGALYALVEPRAAHAVRMPSSSSRHAVLSASGDGQPSSAKLAPD